MTDLVQILRHYDGPHDMGNRLTREAAVRIETLEEALRIEKENVDLRGNFIVTLQKELQSSEDRLNAMEADLKRLKRENDKQHGCIKQLETALEEIADHGSDCWTMDRASRALWGVRRGKL
jgi:chromosome segregation ATPase